jgi:hypothetical protein
MLPPVPVMMQTLSLSRSPILLSLNNPGHTPGATDTTRAGNFIFLLILAFKIVRQIAPGLLIHSNILTNE